MEKYLFKEKKEAIIKYVLLNPQASPKEIANKFDCYEIDAKITISLVSTHL